MPRRSLAQQCRSCSFIEAMIQRTQILHHQPALLWRDIGMGMSDHPGMDAGQPREHMLVHPSFPAMLAVIGQRLE